MTIQNTRRFLGASSLGTSLLLLLSAPGCSGNASEQPIELGTKTQNLGSQSSISCSQEEENTLRHMVMATRAIVNSEEFAECVSRRVESSYEVCPEDPSIARSLSRADLADEMVRLLRNNNPVRFVCAPCEIDTPHLACAELGSPSHAGTMNINITDPFFDQLGKFEGPDTYDDLMDLLGMADTTIHELGHVYGFAHLQDEGDYCPDNTYGSGMPNVLQTCVSISSASFIADREEQVYCNEGETVGIKRTLSGLDLNCSVGHNKSFNSDFTELGEVMTVADFNADGFDDLAVAGKKLVYPPPQANSEPFNVGHVEVFYGSAFGLVRGRAVGVPTGYGFVSSLAAGDFNEDGFDDLVLGLPDGTSDRGVVRIDFGSPDGVEFRSSGPTPAGGTPSPFDSRVIVGETSGDRFGEAVAVSLHGNDDEDVFLAVGAPGKNGRGAVTMYADYLIGTNDWNDPAAFGFEKDLYVGQAGAQFGASLSTLAKNRQTKATLQIGAPGYNGTRGAAFLIKTHNVVEELGDELIAVLENPNGEPGDRLGASGAYGFLGSTDAGQIRATVGAPGADRVDFFDNDGSLRFSVTGDAGSGFGSVLSWGWNKVESANHGKRHLIIGDPASGPGAAQVVTRDFDTGDWVVSQILGQAGLSDEGSTDRFGAAIGWGDFNGDGVEDLAIGAPGEQLGGSGTVFGAVHTFRWDPEEEEADGTPCDLLLPWKSHTQAGGVGEGVQAILPFAEEWFDFGIEEVSAGQTITFQCGLYEALTDTDEGPDVNPDDWRAVTSLLGGSSLPEFGGFPSGHHRWSFSPGFSGTFLYDEANFSEGANSLGFQEVGYTNISSPVFTTNEFPEIGDQVSLDIFLPGTPPGTGYQGAVDIHVSILGTGLINQPLGHIELAGLALGEWHEIHVDFPEPFFSEFLGEDVQAQFHIAVNSHTDEPGGLRIDNLRFTGNTTEHPFASSGGGTIPDGPTDEPFACTGDCLSAIPLAKHEQMGGEGFGTTEDAWYIVSSDLVGWTASQIDGRTIEVNGVPVTNGEVPLPAPVDDVYYFHFSAGAHPWASFTYW